MDDRAGGLVPGAPRPSGPVASPAAVSPSAASPAAVSPSAASPAAVSPPAASPPAASAPADAAVTARHLLARALDAPARLGPVRAVCVDGPAGSGKSTLATALATEAQAHSVPVAVVRLDDLYDGWSGLGGTLWPRLRAQVLEPLRRGRAGRFQRYDWPEGRFAEWVDVPVPALLVLEGCGSASRDADAFASLRVWVQAPDDLRLERGLARDGAAAEPHWRRWMADETALFAAERTSERADVRVDAWGRMSA